MLYRDSCALPIWRLHELDKDGCELTQTVLASLNKVENLATELVINLLHNQYFTV